MNRIQVQIVKTVTAGLVWVREIASPDQALSEEGRKFLELCDQMNYYAGGVNMPARHVTTPAPGKICMGKRRTDMGWYRVRIENILQTTKGHQASCFLLDHGGDLEMIPVQHLREIPEDFLEIPFQAKECVIAGVQPLTMQNPICPETGNLITVLVPCKKWAESAIRFAKRVFEETESSTVEVLSRDSDGKYQVKLYIDSMRRGPNICYNDLLVQEQFAGYTAKPPGPTASESSPIISDTNTDKPTRTRRRQHRSFERFTNVDPLIQHLMSSPSNSCTESDRDSHIAISESVEPPPLDSYLSSDGADDLKTKSSGGRGEHLSQLLGDPPVAGRGIPLSPQGSVHSSPGIGRGKILADASASTGRGLPVVGRGSAPKSPSVEIVLPSDLQVSQTEPSSSSTPIIGGRGRAMIEISRKVGQTPSNLEGKPVHGRGRAMDIIRAIGSGSERSPGTPTPERIASIHDVSDAEQSSDQGSMLNHLRGSKARSGLASRLPAAAKVSAGNQIELKSTPTSTNSVFNRLGPSPDMTSADRMSSRLPSEANNLLMTPTTSANSTGVTPKSNTPEKNTAPKTAGRARSTAHTRCPRVPSRSPTRLAFLSSGRNMSGSPGMSAATKTPVTPTSGFAGSECSPAGENQAKRKSVSFSDQEQTFLVPSRSAVLADTRNDSQEDSWSGGSGGQFRPRGVTIVPALERFAGACKDFNILPQEQKRDPVKPELYGVQVYGPTNPKFHLRVRDVAFSESVHIALANRGIKNASTLQMYMWPALLRGFDAVGVGSSASSRDPAGRTMAYLAPVLTQLGQTSSYETLPISHGPYVIILVPSIRDALRVHHDVETFLAQHPKWRSLVVFAGGAEGSRDIELINGCEVLVVTPHSLLRLLENQTTCLDRLSHLILEQSEKLLEDNFAGKQIQQLMHQYNRAFDQRDESVVAPKQIVAVASQWTPDVKEFADTYMETPTIVISSKLEAAFAGRVEHMALMMSKDQRLEQVLAHVQDLLGQHRRVLVFAGSPETANVVYQTFYSYGVTALCCHEHQVTLKQDEANRQWNLPHRSDSLPVLVTTDACCESLDVKNANCIIHYDPPEKKAELENRLWCMRDTWQSPNQRPGEDAKCCVSYFYMTKASEHIAARVIKLLERSDVQVPKQLVKLADHHQEQTEQGRRSQLCPKLKAFGKCGQERRCRYRHNIFHSLDTPGQNPKYVTVPTQGTVKVLVTYVTHASQYFARLLEVKDENGHVTNLSGDFGVLTLKMSAYFIRPENRVPAEDPEVGELYAFEDVQHIFHRVEVSSLSEVGPRGLRDEAMVHFVDTGDDEKVQTSKLLVIPEELRDIKYQAVEIFVCRVKPRDQDTEWTRTIGARIAEEIQNKELTGNIVLSLGHSLWLESLVHCTRLHHLKENIIKFSVRGVLLTEEMAEENPKHIEWLTEICKGKVDIPASHDPEKSTTRAITVHGMVMNPMVYEVPEHRDYLDVLITATDTPDLFFVQQYQQYDKIVEMNYDITEYVRVHDFKKPEKLVKSTLVLAKFPDPEKDNISWNRGKIADALEENMYDVFFVDSGESELVHISSILPLPARFQMVPFHALECCMHGVEPAGDDWTDEVGDWLYLVSRKESGSSEARPLSAKIVSRATARHSGKVLYSLELYDCMSEYDINLSHRLIFDGLARPSAAAILEMFGQLSSLSSGSVEADIIGNCQIIVQAHTSDLRVEAATIICSHITSHKGLTSHLVMSGVLNALCWTIQLCREPAVLGSLLTSYVTLTQGMDRRDSLEPRETHMLGSLCWTLDTVSNRELISIILGALKTLVQEKVYRVSLFTQGGPRILGQIIASASSSVSSEPAAYILQQILTELTAKELPNVVDSKCLEVISEEIDNRPDSTIICSCLNIMENLATTHKKMRDAIRKAGGVKAICVQLENFNHATVKEMAVHTLKALANDNRFTKDVMNELKVSPILQRLAEDTSLAGDARTVAGELAQRLRDLLPNRRSPTKKLREQTVSNSHDVGADEIVGNHVTATMDGIRPLSEIKNRPLPPKFRSTTEPIKSAKPSLKWAQDRWNVWLTIDVKNVQHRVPEIAQYSEDSVYFRAVVESTEYMFHFHLYEVIQPEKCETRVSIGNVMLGLRKKSMGKWPRLTKEKQKPSYLTTDLDRFNGFSSDEDLEDGEEEDVEEPKDGPIQMARMTCTVPTFSRAPQAGYRFVEGMPPEIVSSLGDGSSSSDESDIEDFREENPNRKYGYFDF